MIDISTLAVRPEATLREAMLVLDKARVQIVLVTDPHGKLMGTCTDGDIRRALLAGRGLNDRVDLAMNRNPRTASPEESNTSVRARMRRQSLLQMPIVRGDGTVQSMVLLSDPRLETFSDIPVVLMVGGLGTRLLPLTQNCPKPMLPIGGRPLLERIVERFRDQGFERFYFAVNYLSHMIEDFFRDGARHDVSITYLKEEEKLGSGGALSLLPGDFNQPIIVMNGDIITELDFRHLLDLHNQTEAEATMVVREHRTAIPFGVVEFEGHAYRDVKEKPTLVHHINAGIYCVSPSALDLLPKNTFFDMPDLFTELATRQRGCGVYELHDLWYDVGTHADFERAQSLFVD